MLPAKLSPTDLAPETGTSSARSKFPLVLTHIAANHSLLLSTLLHCEICLDGSADCILSISFNGNTKERQVPHLGNQVGRGTGGIRLLFLSPTLKIPITKRYREQETLLPNM